MADQAAQRKYWIGELRGLFAPICIMQFFWNFQ